MAKVHPYAPTSTCNYMSSRRETFTVWMKSLVFHGNGCTVFDSNGEIVYRIDNYGDKCSNEVHLMDLPGNVLFTIRRKKWLGFIIRRWEGYKWSGGTKMMMNKEKSWVQVKSSYCCFKILNKSRNCKVTILDNRIGGCYKMIVGLLARKSTFKIIGPDDRLVAEVTRKESSSGVVLGNDVFTLAVEPRVDHSFIMSLVAVYGLINRKM